MIDFLLYQSIHPTDPAGMLILADHLEEQGDHSGADTFRNLQSVGFASLAMFSAGVSSFAEVSAHEFASISNYYSVHNIINNKRIYVGTAFADQFERLETNSRRRQSRGDLIESFGIGLGDDYSSGPRSSQGGGMRDAFGWNDGSGEGIRENWMAIWIENRQQRSPGAETETFGSGCEFPIRP